MSTAPAPHTELTPPTPSDILVLNCDVCGRAAMDFWAVPNTLVCHSCPEPVAPKPVSAGRGIDALLAPDPAKVIDFITHEQWLACAAPDMVLSPSRGWQCLDGLQFSSFSGTWVRVVLYVRDQPTGLEYFLSIRKPETSTAIVKSLEASHRIYPRAGVGLDAWSSQEVRSSIPTAIDIRMALPTMSPVLRELKAAVLSKRLMHDGDHAMWVALKSVRITEDRNGNLWARRVPGLNSDLVFATMSAFAAWEAVQYKRQTVPALGQPGNRIHERSGTLAHARAATTLHKCVGCGRSVSGLDAICIACREANSDCLMSVDPVTSDLKDIFCACAALLWIAISEISCALWEKATATPWRKAFTMVGLFAAVAIAVILLFI